jgi:hypothetical protein
LGECMPVVNGWVGRGGTGAGPPLRAPAPALPNRYAPYTEKPTPEHQAVIWGLEVHQEAPPITAMASAPGTGHSAYSRKASTGGGGGCAYLAPGCSAFLSLYLSTSPPLLCRKVSARLSTKKRIGPKAYQEAHRAQHCHPASPRASAGLARVWAHTGQCQTWIQASRCL